MSPRAQIPGGPRDSGQLIERADIYDLSDRPITQEVYNLSTQTTRQTDRRKLTNKACMLDPVKCLRDVEGEGKPFPVLLNGLTPDVDGIS